jgi:hypothetical protein
MEDVEAVIMRVLLHALRKPSVKRVETSAAALKGSLSVAYVGSFKSAGEKVSSDTGCTSVPSGATDFAECISA